MRDPLYPILTDKHLHAIDRRHTIIMGAVQDCIAHLGADVVVVESWSHTQGRGSVQQGQQQ